MVTFGIDIGSTTSKCVLMENGLTILSSSLLVGGIGTKSPDMAVSQALAAAGISKENVAATAATGYGRSRYEYADYNVSELSCHAIGARHIFPSVRTIIDIGGQDAKVVSLDEEGRMRDFLMNDKCAAGTGRFLDVMANVLAVPVDEFGDYCMRANSTAQISSTCTVFAESEVISQLANGVEMEGLIAGICASVAGRVASLAKRIQIMPDVCMSGGVARNDGVREYLAKSIGHSVLFSDKAQLFGAIGAALFAYKKVIGA